MTESLQVSDAKSPCVQICQLSPEDVCIGCGRTRGEIARWTGLDDSTKLKVKTLARQRLQRTASISRTQTEPQDELRS